MLAKKENGLIFLLILGIVFHVIYSMSIFDIYFRSPLVHGMTPVQVQDHPAPAKRLVLVVADGLRADKVFQVDGNGQSKMPFLRKIIEEQGVWGISHTRVPTETRPGHVAIIAGFYEDMSSVTKGFKMNPVEFDTVFNESQYTWSFGSPNVLPMFKHGAKDVSKIEIFTYEAENEDFASKDASLLDEWVFDQFKQLLEKSKTDEELERKLRSEKIIVFLHLLGLDTNGHAHSPNSKEYYDNIRLVDRRLEEFTQLWESYFHHDDRTSYVFTSDHGMNERGSHGDGDPDCTRTPLIAWGAGIEKPSKVALKDHDKTSATWKLDYLERKDVEQADIAPLMTSLLGIPFPLNSVGTLPLNYLNNSEKYKAFAILANARQIFAQYLKKEELKVELELVFKPYAPLKEDTASHPVHLLRIEQLIKNGNYVEAQVESHKLIRSCLEGLRYLQTYDRLFLKFIISMGYVGWMIYCVNFVIRNYVFHPHTIILSHPIEKTKHICQGLADLIDLQATLVWILACFYLAMKASPKLYYAYVTLPIFLWFEVIKHKMHTQIHLLNILRQQMAIKYVWRVLFYIAVMEILVFSYFKQELLCFCFIMMATWPICFEKKFRDDNHKIIQLWSIFCILTGLFVLFPLTITENIQLIVAAGVVVAISGMVAYIYIDKIDIPDGTVSKSHKISINRNMIIALCQICAILLTIYMVASSSASLKAKNGLPIVNQVTSWIILVSSNLLPFIYGPIAKQHYIHRLITIYLAFAPGFILLSLSYEGLFYFIFSSTLLIWLILERRLYRSSKTHLLNHESSDEIITHFHRSLTIKDSRVASFFMIFMTCAFFGTGNVASVGSFSIPSVFRLITVFNPFMMGSLLILKLLIPFFLVSAVFEILVRCLELSPFSLFLLVLSTTDIMTLNFFFFVRDEGSWLEIGTSVSHFFIANVFIIFIIVLFIISHWLVGRAIIPQEKVASKSL